MKEEETTKLSDICAALGNEKRLHIIEILLYHGPCSVVELTNSLDDTYQSSVSHHLEILARVGLVEMEKAGLYHFYSCPAPIENAIKSLLLSAERIQVMSQHQTVVA